MHFVSDKELRKVPAKKSTSRPIHTTSSTSTFPSHSSNTLISFNLSTLDSSSHLNEANLPSSSLNSNGTKIGATSSSISTSDDIVERSRIEREKRQQNKLYTIKVIVIQRYWRGRRVYYSVIKDYNEDFDKKVNDIEKVAMVLTSKGVKSFCPPEAVSLLLIRYIIFQYKKKWNGKISFREELWKRWIRLLEIIVLPSLQAEGNKNLSISLCKSNENKFLLSKLSTILFDCLIHPEICKLPYTNQNSRHKSIILETILRIIGGFNSSPTDSQSTESIVKESFRKIRFEIIGIDKIFYNIRSYLILCADSLLQRYNMASTINMISIRQIISDHILYDTAFSILLYCIDSVDSIHSRDLNRSSNDVVLSYTVNIITIPLVTILLSENKLVEYVSSKYFSILLSKLCLGIGVKDLDILNQSISSINTIGVLCGHWLLGNIAYIGSYVITSLQSSDNKLESSSLSGVYLEVSRELLLNYPLASVLCGRAATIWTKEGSTLTVASIPILLQYQILANGLLQSDFIRLVSDKFLAPVVQNTTIQINMAMENEKDVLEVTEALKKIPNAIGIAQDSVKMYTESSTPFTSKWAQKLFQGILPTSISLSSSSSSKLSVQKSVASTKAESTRNDQSNSKASSSSSLTTKSIDIYSVMGTVRLWSMLLPLGALATADSIPWKGLSTLTFSKDSIRRLISTLYYFLSLSGYSSLEAYAVKFDPTKDMIYDYSYGKNKRKDYGSEIYATLICLSSVLKVALISTDDDDLYDITSTSSGNNNNNTNRLSLVQYLPIIRAGKVILSRIIRHHQHVALDPFAISNNTNHPYINNSSVSTTASEFSSYSSSNNNSNSTSSISSFFSSLFGPSSSSSSIVEDRNSVQNPRNKINLSSEPMISSNMTSHLHHDNNNSNNSTSSSLQLESLQIYGSVRCLSAILSDLHTRWARYPFSLDHSLWELTGSDAMTSYELKDYNNPNNLITTGILRVMPWTIPFTSRLKLVRNYLDSDRHAIQGTGGDILLQAFSSQQRSKGTIVRIRRNNILIDGMNAFKQLKSIDNYSSHGSSNSSSSRDSIDTVGSIRDRIVVRYIDDRGEEEKGIDLGGLFKDFLTDLSQKIFDPSYGLFSITPNDNLLYPNPNAKALYAEDTYSIYYFVGQVLGKAIYEDISIQPQFAHFFLCFMHGKYSFLHLFDDLKSLDAELYKNLKFLKTYEGKDIEDVLCLTFSVTDNSYGVSKEIELFPGGSNVPVNASNRMRYIDEVAKYYLHDRIKLQAQAFFQGLYSVVQSDLFCVFSAPELQVIISGMNSILDIDDLRRNCRYSGGYLPLDTYTSRFWSVVSELDEIDRKRLLRFVTSCERSPSLGFSALQPPFTVQRIECSDDMRLPSASTCFNILKLPTYSSKKIMKERLLTAIRSNAGFDLS